MNEVNQESMQPITAEFLDAVQKLNDATVPTAVIQDEVRDEQEVQDIGEVSVD